MENEGKANSKNTKNININVGEEGILKQIKKFYDENLKKWHIIVFIIIAILYTISFVGKMIELNNSGLSSVTSAVNPLAFGSQVRDSGFLTLIMLIAGITPYVPISVFGAGQALNITTDMVLRSAYGLSYMPTLYVGGLIQVIGISLSVVIGLYFCKLTTKRNKFEHSTDYGMDDIKKHFYEIKKDEKKLQEIANKKEAKAKEMQSYNVKIPYLMFIILSVLAFVFEFIGIAITKI
ncbi:MAG: hypothetical protein J6A15_06095 [Clostridia bacterium]|nr:hypothetical protein [Clostridia bacterium]